MCRVYYVVYCTIILHGSSSGGDLHCYSAEHYPEFLESSEGFLLSPMCFWREHAQAKKATTRVGKIDDLGTWT